MKYEVKKAFWHRNRPVSVGEVLDLDPDGARWLVGQGKVVQVSGDTGQESGGRDQVTGGGDQNEGYAEPQEAGRPKRKGSGRAAAEKTNVPEAPAENKGDGK